MLTQENLKEIINYNPDTGVFTWSKNRGGLIKIGAIAGTNKTDRRGKAYQHIQIKIDGIMIHLGCFKEIDDAIDARKKANKEYNFHENHGKQRPK